MATNSVRDEKRGDKKNGRRNVERRFFGNREEGGVGGGGGLLRGRGKNMYKVKNKSIIQNILWEKFSKRYIVVSNR